MIINHNLNSMNAHRNMSINTTQTGKAMEKLSSGLRINRAGDDAAGLAISEKMRGQIRGLDQASRNAQDGISLIQTAEGALNETHSMLQRVRELVVQADNGTNTAADRDAIQKEIGELSNEITDTAEKTKFNTLSLINGSAGVQTTAQPAGFAAAGVKVDVSNADASSSYVLSSANATSLTLTSGGVSQTITVPAVGTVAAGTELNFDSLGVKLSTSATTDFSGTNLGTITTGASSALKFQIGANNTANEAINLSIGNMRADALGNAAPGQKVSDINVTSTTQTYNTRIDILDKAIATVSTERANLGSKQNRLEHTINNLGTTSENLTAAESRVRDVDMAKEMMNFTKNNILNQAAQAMMSQSNQQPQAVLQLLR